MDQEMMKFMHELKEFVHKAEKFLQSQGGDFGQRGGYYGMRDGGSQGGGYNQGGNYGQRQEPWMHGPQGYQDPNWGGGGGNFPNIDPRYFM
jgi:hypothetical protein